MTNKIDLELVEAAVFTCRDSELESEINELVDKLRERRGKTVTEMPFPRIYLEDAFPKAVGCQIHEADRSRKCPRHEECSKNKCIDKKNYDDFVRRLQTSHLAIIDLSFNNDSLYVMAMRQLLSSGTTIALAPSDKVSTIANARFVLNQTSADKKSKLWRYIDVSSPDWLDEALEQSRAADEPQLKAWQHDVKTVGAFKVSQVEKTWKEVEGGVKEGLHATTWRAPMRGQILPRAIGPTIKIWKGDITRATGFSVWVNSENTYMEMARFWDKSVSARIRDLGSVEIGLTGDLSGDKRKDALGLALAEQMGTRKTVPIGHVFITPTNPASKLHTEQGNGNGVKYVAHLAAVQPRKSKSGFESGGKIDDCVKNVLHKLHKHRLEELRKQAGIWSTILRFIGAANKPLRAPDDEDTILFPLIGSGDGGAHVSLVVHQMVAALRDAIQADYEKKPEDREICGKVGAIGLIAYQPSHLSFIERDLENHGFISDKPEGAVG